jgi:hypothetical protein
MKVLKLVIGVLSLALSAFIVFQSCAVGLGNTLSENGEVGGTGGLFVAIFFIAAGVVGIATRNSIKKGGSIATAILYLLSTIVGFASAGSYSDLNVWAGLSVAFAIVYIISIFVGKKNREGV